MSPIILSSFIIPAIVAVVLTVMLIKESDNLISKKTGIRSQQNKRTKNRTDEQQMNRPSENKVFFTTNKKDWDNFWDFSGGTMGI